MIDTNIYFILVGLIVLLSVLVVAITLTYTQSINRLKKLQQGEDEVFQATKEKQKELLTAAETKAKDLISQATEIHSESEDKLNQAVAALTENERKELEGKSAQLIKAFEEELTKINSQNIDVFKNVSNDVMNQIKSHLDEFTKLLETETVESQKTADSKIKEEYDKLEVELKEHKEKTFQKIDQNIYSILLNVSKVAFGKGLNLQDHEKLIAEALEEAKKESYL